MTGFTEEDVVAFIDGQMDAKAKSTFAEQLAVEPELAKSVAAHQWMARQIVAAYGNPPNDAFSGAQIAELGLGRDNIVKLGVIRPPMPGAWIKLATGITAIAASLAVGFVGARSFYSPNTNILTQADGKVIAAGDLDRALSSNPSAQKGQIQISMTFRTADGVCRTFALKPRLSGIGCQNGGHWTIPVMAESGSNLPNGTDYQLASGDISSTVMAEVDRRIVGAPLTSEEEQKVLGLDQR